MKVKAGVPPTLRFAVPGLAKPWPRPVTAADGHVYAARSADGWMHQVRASCVEALEGPGWPREGAFQVGLSFYLLRPKSHLRANGDLTDAAPVSHLRVPDVDNLAKAVMDALGDWRELPPLLWFDDGQVTGLRASKAWTPSEKRAGCEVRIWWAEQ